LNDNLNTLVEILPSLNIIRTFPSVSVKQRLQPRLMDTNWKTFSSQATQMP